MGVLAKELTPSDTSFDADCNELGLNRPSHYTGLTVIVPKKRRQFFSSRGKNPRTRDFKFGPLPIYIRPTLKPHGTLQLAHTHKFRWHTHKFRRGTLCDAHINLPLQLARIFIARSLGGEFPCGLLGLKPTIWNSCQKERTLIQN